VKIASINENSASTIKSVRFKRKELLFCLLTTLFLFCLLISPVAAKVTELKISPWNPAVGETVKVTGKASPDESITAQVTVHLRAPVSGRLYRLAVDSIKVPSGMNSITIKASGVKNLRVKVGPFSKESQASKGGIATLTATSVPPLNYNIVIEGDALSKSSVPLTISASKTFKADSDGTFEFEFDTTSMPAGTYIVKVGNKERIVQLGSKGHGNGQDNWDLNESLTGLFSWIKQLGSK
jgi:hypothetical protein